MMDAFYLAHLQRVNDKANVTVPREPGCMMLVADFIAVANAVLLDRPVTANVENSWYGLVEVFWDVKVARYIECRSGLIVNFLDDELIVLDLTGDNGFEVGLFRKRLKSEHLE